jgi:hypothetical protein
VFPAHTGFGTVGITEAPPDKSRALIKGEMLGMPASTCNGHLWLAGHLAGKTVDATVNSAFGGTKGG